MAEETESGTKAQKTITLGEMRESADSGSVQKFVEFVSGLARGQRYGEERISEIAKASTEALENIVGHAFRGAGGDIQITCTLDRAERIVLKIVDWGQPFNMLLAGDPMLKEEYAEQGVPQPSARFIKKLTDTVEYQRLENMNYLLLTFSQVIKGKR